jgi:hypothetical protein
MMTKWGLSGHVTPEMSLSNTAINQILLRIIYLILWCKIMAPKHCLVWFIVVFLELHGPILPGGQFNFIDVHDNGAINSSGD